MVKMQANQAQEKAEQDGKIIIKDSIDIFTTNLTRPAGCSCYNESKW